MHRIRRHIIFGTHQMDAFSTRSMSHSSNTLMLFPLPSCLAPPWNFSLACHPPGTCPRLIPPLGVLESRLSPLPTLPWLLTPLPLPFPLLLLWPLLCLLYHLLHLLYTFVLPITPV